MYCYTVYRIKLNAKAITLLHNFPLLISNTFLLSISLPHWFHPLFLTSSSVIFPSTHNNHENGKKGTKLFKFFRHFYTLLFFLHFSLRLQFSFYNLKLYPCCKNLPIPAERSHWSCL